MFRLLSLPRSRFLNEASSKTTTTTSFVQWFKVIKDGPDRVFYHSLATTRRSISSPPRPTKASVHDSTTSVIARAPQQELIGRTRRTIGTSTTRGATFGITLNSHSFGEKQQHQQQQQQQHRGIMSTQILRSYASHLTRKVVDLIRARGPLTVADYMKIVLTNPENGFYMDRDVFGAKGHFTTNPEISQIFGEICGVWILNEWQRFQCPKPLRIVELGPGRGTLMSDIARTLHQFRQSREVSSLHMIEVSPFLTQVQEQTLCGTTSLIGRNENYQSGGKHNSLTKNGLPVTWYRSLEQLEPIPRGFTAFVAHEFFDALPVHKFVRDPKPNGPWRELLVDYGKDHELRFAISKQATMASTLLAQAHEQDHQLEHLEVCPEAGLHVANIMKRLNTKNSGCMLLCDYGFEDPQSTAYNNNNKNNNNNNNNKDNTRQQKVSNKQERPNRDTFRGFREHGHWPPLKEPGTADLTADVDFGYLKQQVQDQAVIFGPVNQADFLWKCGIQMRLEQLMQGASDDEKSQLSSGVQMMINDMGQRYKFMALFPKDAESLFKNNPPAGFDQAPV